MAKSRETVVVSTRVARETRALIRALAEAEQTTAAEVMQRLLIPAVRRRLAELANEGEAPQNAA
ncbi:hypothetical protein BH23GEM7_BH23GEM7_27260 [soil metagenome]|jgi:hypothetical protein